ncbi:MAG TPA: M1 family aminopeptidase [Candidatus Polarisedimenticolaceae bacterium]|nr:M1 family aminopeptidase [Candidatus Polarisedimenticolaceae bacterium]
MSFRRLWLVFKTDLALHARRPLTWILVVIMILVVWGLSTGNVRIDSGDASVGGRKAWITSEFAIAFTLSVITLLFYTFFVAVGAGMAVIQDDERKVGEVLHATPLTPHEYVWGKLLAVIAAFAAVLAIQQLFAIVAYQWFPNAKADEIRGPFTVVAYTVPALLFAMPTILFIAFTSFAVGLRWRKPILVFVLPVAMLLVCAFFLWNWSPTWLDPKWNKLLMALDPAGFRWLNETHLKVDRGVDFYNKGTIPFDAVFWVSRAAMLGVALLSFVLAERHFARTMRGEVSPAEKRRLVAAAPSAPPALARPQIATAPLGALAMRTVPPRFWQGAMEVARTELRELAHAPGLYLFVPLILIQTIGANFTALGPFGTYVLATPGTVAVRMMNTLTLLVSFLLLFYTVESHQRERNTGLAAIFDATPVRTASVLFGKSVANAVVGIAVLAGCFIGSAIIILVQGKVSLAIFPFLLTWGLLLVPTFLVWSCFVMAAVSITQSRYATYGIGLIALAASGWAQVRGHMSWVFNWNLWGALRWTDMGPYQMDRTAIVLNRVLVLSLAALFVVVAVRFHGRRDADPVRIIHRLRPRALFGSALSLSPYALVPLVLASTLGVMIGRGEESEAAKKKAHDYWKQNLATWKDAPQPEIVDLKMKLKLDPEKRHFAVEGGYTLSNPHDKPLARFALTGGFHWTEPKWTMGGKEYKPENRTSLFAFTPPKPLGPGETIDVGFAYEGTFPKGATKNGGGSDEFIFPAGVVLTGFGPSFAPEVGYDEGIGIEEEKNRYETKVYPDDFYVGQTDPAFGSGSAFTARIEITGPEEYRYNSVGILESDKVENGMRTAVWKTDRKVRMFNVVAGKWAVKQGEGTAIYYYPGHDYNIDELLAGLNGARKYYAQWFHEYPWQELKLSEFPGLATYAQGFATDITFSESIGFLTQQEKTGDAPFTIAAHESAHQWWGNLLLPGKGPGGNLLSEGMSHYSTILLTEQVKGVGPRIEFCKRIEERYGESRQVDSEKPMVKIDGSKPGDTTVTYDKMGWVVWMLQQQMGRDNLLHGLHDFQTAYDDNPDHPVLQDLTAFLRPYAPDAAAYDAFIQQWFNDVVVSEYTLDGAKKTEANGGWDVTVKVTNKGSATMPVEIAAATKAERFDDKGVASNDYKDARATVTLAKGESKDVTIHCAFAPERVLVDPDALVLQLRRKTAVAKL